MEDIKVILKKNAKGIRLEESRNVSQTGAAHSVIISGNNSLTNRRLDSLGNDINDLKESLEVSQNDNDDKFKNMEDKVQKLEEQINLMKEELNVV